MEAMVIMQEHQMQTVIIWKKKKRPGTSMILLVWARKSAEASITSMASLSDLYPQQMQQKKAEAKMPTMIVPIKRYFYELSNASY